MGNETQKQSKPAKGEVEEEGQELEERAGAGDQCPAAEEIGMRSRQGGQS